MSLISKSGKNYIPKNKDKSAQESKSDYSISFVMYDEYETTEIKKLLNRYNEICNEKMKATNLEIKENTITFLINGELGFISFMPAPYPWKDLEGPCATSWMWREASEVLINHKKHIIISWMSKSNDLILKSTVVSQLTVSVLEEVNGYGVYWGNAALDNKKDVFCGMVYDIEKSGLPLFLWIDFRLEKNPNGSVNIITYGLAYFGVMEIEIIESRKKFEEILDFAFNIARYLIENGNVIKDGDTIGDDENKKITASHSQSVWKNDNRGLVLRVNY